jgi:outer membrane receptor protein involved in Fe transport
MPPLTLHRTAVKTSLPRLFRAALTCCLALSSSVPSLRADSAGFEEVLFSDMEPMPGVLTMQSRSTLPVALTTISSEEIRHSSARNLMDLLETYVPGVMPWGMRTQGDTMNIRGLVSNKDDKWLYLVDGQDMVERGNTFSQFEERLWDMNDIERVEVIRGPGSVTYGVGAIMGVINVVTKDAAGTAPDMEAGAQYTGSYDTQILHAAINRRWGNGWRGYFYASGSRSKGVFPEMYKAAMYPPVNRFGPPTVNGVSDPDSVQDPLSDVGDLSRPSLGRGPGGGAFSGQWNNFLGDYMDRPMAKLQASLRNDTSALWFRYTQQGNHTPSGGFTTHQMPFADKASEQSAGHQFSKWHLVLEDDRPLVENRLKVKSSAAVGSYNVESRVLVDYTLTDEYPYDTPLPFSSPVYCAECYSLDTVTGKSVFNLTVVPERLELAAGAEYAYDTVGAGWGDPMSQLKVGDSNALLMYGPDTPVQEIYRRFGSAANAIIGFNNGVPGVNAAAHYVGGGFGVKRWSYLGEFNARVHPRLLNVIVSGRQDDYSTDKPLFSPRLALVSDVNGVGVFKAITQKSYRLPSYATRKFLINRGQQGNYETIRDTQLIFAPTLDGKMSGSVGVFYNDIDVLGYGFDTAVGTSLIGHLITRGAEVEFRATAPRYNVGVNHTYIKQVNFHAANRGADSDVSMSQITSLSTTPEGNDLLRTPNHLTKVFGELNTFERKVIWHADSLINWGIPGNEDGLQAMEKGTYPNAITRARVQNQVNQARDLDWYKLGVKVNASVSYETGPVTMTLFGQNLISWGGDYRYYAGTSGFGRPQLGDSTNANANLIANAIKEPLVVGFRVAYKL